MGAAPGGRRRWAGAVASLKKVEPGLKPWTEERTVAGMTKEQQNGAPRTDASETGTARAATRLLSPGGALSEVFPGFESRPQQVRMAEAVADILVAGGVGLIEAGTGTGKSLAYLTPAALHARETGRRIIVSTHTHNLQEQLLRDDVPMLQSALAASDPEAGLEAAVMKGWSNYLCLWRLGQAGLGQQDLFPDGGQRLHEQLLRWAEEGGHGGTREEADFPIPPDAWEEVCAESDTCSRQRCPHFDDCYYFRARRQAQAADIIIVNHHLLCADFAVRRQAGWDGEAGVLPRADSVVFDEAHHLEDIFTQHFGLSFSPTRLQRLLLRIQGRGQGRGGLFGRLQRLLAENPAVGAAQSLAAVVSGPGPQAVAAARMHGENFFSHVALLAREHTNRGPGEPGRDAGRANDGGAMELTRGMVEPRFWQPLGDALEHLHALLTRLAEDVKKSVDDEPEVDALVWEMEALARRAQAAAEDLVALVEPEDSQLVYWLEPHGRRRKEWALRGAPVDVGPVVRETMLENVGSVVMTSATLSAGDRFQYFKQRLGLDAWSNMRAEESIASPFNYEEQVLLCAAEGLPWPERREFLPTFSDALRLWLEASGGRAFVLFTSYRALDSVYDRLAPWLQERGMTGLRQQPGVSRAWLLERFREAKQPVLFGADSFWEGVDVPGDALSLVVLARLPFRVPTDPVAKARRDALQRRNLDSFDHFTLPQAVMRLRQGFGRLIRSSKDRGAVVVADGRLLGRPYGRKFLASLPKTARHRGGPQSIARAVADWLG